MLLSVQDCLIQVGNAPSLRNIIVKQFHQLLTGFCSDIISPCTECYKKLALFIKRHITMHHGTDTQCTYRFQFYIIFRFYILRHILIAVLDTCPDIFQAVCPDSVFVTVFPLMSAGCDRLIFIIHKYCLDSGGSELNTKCCFVCKDRCFCFCCSHLCKPPIILFGAAARMFRGSNPL